MKCPPEKAVACAAEVMVCGFVAMAVMGVVSGMMLPSNGGFIWVPFPDGLAMLHFQ